MWDLDLYARLDLDTFLPGIPILADERGGFSRSAELQRSNFLQNLWSGEPLILLDRSAKPAVRFGSHDGSSCLKRREGSVRASLRYFTYSRTTLIVNCSWRAASWKSINAAAASR